MARPRQKHPTSRELDVLKVLWSRGPSTVREVLDVLNTEQRVPLAYNTVLTVLSVMQRKGYVTRDESEKTHLYLPTKSRVAVEQSAVDRLVSDLFGGSAMQLVTRALSTQLTSPSEMAEVEELLNELRRRENADE